MVVVGWCWSVKWHRFVMTSKDLEHLLMRLATESACCRAATACTWRSLLNCRHWRMLLCLTCRRLSWTPSHDAIYATIRLAVSCRVVIEVSTSSCWLFDGCSVCNERCWCWRVVLVEAGSWQHQQYWHQWTAAASLSVQCFIAWQLSMSTNKQLVSRRKVLVI